MHRPATTPFGIALAMLLALLSAASIAYPQASSYQSALDRIELLLKEQKPKEAATLAEEAIQMDGARFEAYLAAATAYTMQQFHDDAIGMLQLALARAPQERKTSIRAAIADARRATAPPPGPAVSTAPTTPPPEADLLLWKSIEASKNADDFRGYLRAFPQGLFAEVAKSRIDTLDWLTAQAKSKPEDLETYIAVHPDGFYLAAAQARIAELKRSPAAGEAKADYGTTFLWQHRHLGSERELAESKGALAESKGALAENKGKIGPQKGTAIGKGPTVPAILVGGGVLIEGKLRLLMGGISWTEDPTQVSAMSSHNFSIACASLKLQRADAESIDFFVNGQTIRLVGAKNMGEETTQFLNLLKKHCPY